MSAILTSGLLKDQLLSTSSDTALTSPHVGSQKQGDNGSGAMASDILPISYGFSNDAGTVVTKIEDIFEAMADCLIGRKKELVIHLKSRPRSVVKGSDTSSQEASTPQLRAITYPSRSPQEAWKFTALLRILELTHEALVTDMVITKRDIYYRDPELFLKQAVVDRYVDDLAYTFGVERDAMNVVAAAKGLIAGYCQITTRDHSIVDYSATSEGMLVPSTKGILDVDFNEARWILVIEKEATFRTLASSQYWKTSDAGKGIIITAKGYPDIQTRQFLCMLSRIQPSIPILALVDFDPDGLGIMSTYKYGSIALAHETNSLAVSSLKWLGIKTSDAMICNPGVIQLSARDRKVAARMLERKEFEREEEWRSELQQMLLLNIKAEIQILGNGEALQAWLNMKLASVSSYSSAVI
ncbi:type IIB DNA topoisomerase [Phlyctema vagabunda]|uniref:DNA topoisomerase (ATP-hydrolyzing) n=1 Tax=Phlyctema vagabunda TaxID=108571 RepID=A0ABR4PJ13_9HELO